MKFSNVVGQEALKHNLISSIKQKTYPHSHFFLGNEGYGSFSLAIAYIQYLFCRNRSNKDSCGVCRSCLMIQNLEHPDLFFVFPNTSLNNEEANKSKLFRDFIRKSQGYFNLIEWKELLNSNNKQLLISRKEADKIIKESYLTPYESNYKVFIIWRPELINLQAANTLLKVLEEPPLNTLFICIGDTVENILPTIISRVQLVRVKKIEDKEIRDFLKEKHSVSVKDTQKIVDSSKGNLIELLKLLERKEDQVDFLDSISNLMCFTVKADIIKVIDWVNDISNLGREFQKLFIKYFSILVRKSLVINFSNFRQIHINTKEMVFLSKYANCFNGYNYQEIIREINDLYVGIKANGNPKLLFTHFSLRLTKIIRIKK